jgi:nucleotide-binding universal stress UspA family protein
MYDKILVPLDGSPTAARGFDEALALARALKSALVLLHVVDTAPVMVEMVTATTWQDISDSLRQQGQQLLEQAHEAATAQGVASESRLIEGRIEPVADIIVAEATASHCALVVMGTHGRRGFSHVVMGSNAERVVRQCPLPVLLVRQPESALLARPVAPAA